MSKETIFTIITTLIERTNKKEVKWILSSAPGINSYPEDFVVNLDNKKINIYRDNANSVYFHLFTDNGVTIEFFSLDPRDDEYSLLDELLTSANNYFYNKDEIVQETINELQKPGVIGKDEEIPF